MLRFSMPASFIVCVALVCSLLGCIVPVPALSAASAIALPRKYAYGVSLGAWLVNQFVGFVFRGYPHTGSAYAWGVALAIAAIGCVALARFVWLHREQSITSAILVFGVTFVAYEAMLALISIPLGGWDAYTVEIITKIATFNACAFACIAPGATWLVRANATLARA